MFDINDDDHTRVSKGLPARIGEEEGEADGFVVYDGESGSPEELAEEEETKLHCRLMGYYQQELDRQSLNRVEMAMDEDYYDNYQWAEEDAQVLKDRGQAPICYNVISQTINWIIGSEKRSRTDFNILPRGKEDAKPAERKTQLLKYLGDVNKTTFHRSRAFEDTVKVGLGWLEDGVTNGDDGEPIYSRYESWRNVLWDSAATEFDISDGRYLFRNKWVDLDIAQAYFPGRQALLKRSVNASDLYGMELANGDEVMDYAEEDRESLSRGLSEYSAERQRVRMLECWYRVPVMVKKVLGGQFNGEEYDPEHRGHTEQVGNGMAVLADRMQMKMFVTIMTTTGIVATAPSPYRHNKFPFTPIWGYRRGRDNMPYGVIRALRDIQDDINKRASKAQFILASRQVIMEEGAVDKVEEMLEEAARPDGVIITKNGKRFDFVQNEGLAASHIQLMTQGIGMIQSVSGVTDELMGRTTNAKSGVAIQARQEQGSMSTSKLFDNLRFAVQLQGEKELSMVEQFMTEQKQFRITNARMQPEFIDINDGLPENDIARSKADFIIDNSEARASLRQAAVDQLVEMMARMPPNVAMVVLDLVVDSMDLPNREEIVKRIRQATGMSDPDATEMTPEQQAAQEAAAKQQHFQEQMAQAQLSQAQAKAQKDQASAQKTMVEMANTNVDTQQKAVDAASVAMQSSGILPVADAILKESGFVSKSEEEAQQVAAQQEQQQQAQAQAEQQQMAEQQAQEQAQQEEQAQQQQQQQSAPQPGQEPTNPAAMPDVK